MSDSKRSIELEIQQIQVDDSLVSMTPTRILEFQLLLPMDFVGESFRGGYALTNEYTLLPTIPLPIAEITGHDEMDRLLFPRSERSSDIILLHLTVTTNYHHTTSPSTLDPHLLSFLAHPQTHNHVLPADPNESPRLPGRQHRRSRRERYSRPRAWRSRRQGYDQWVMVSHLSSYFSRVVVRVN